MSSSRPSEHFIAIENLTVDLPTGHNSSIRAVRSVSLEVRAGERVGIVGESGSGKSVTGRALAGLLPTSPRVQVSGSITYANKELIGATTAEWDEIRRSKISMIFQDPLSYLNPTMKVGKQVREAVRVGSPAEKTAKTIRFLDMAGLDNPAEVARKFPSELSGGMRQRVLIAIALAKEPALIIADEPTTALDVTVQKRVIETLDHDVTELGTALVMISHDLAVVAQLCDWVYVMRQGEIVESGSTLEVFTRPKHPYTQGLLRSVRSLSDDSDILYSYSSDETADVEENVPA